MRGRASARSRSLIDAAALEYRRQCTRHKRVKKPNYLIRI
jgi:hypothetical protein